MTPERNRRWIVIAAAMLIVVVGLWVLTALQLNPAAAGGSRISISLRSGLAADYAARAGGLMGGLNLSIVSDVMQDLGMGAAEAEAHADEMAAELAQPVPTATALNFAGDPPPTATPTADSPPTNTPTPTPTFTWTATPRPTDTPKPTDTAKPAATDSPSDTKSPQHSGAVVSPSDGSTIGCTQMVDVTDLRVLDPDYSSGINWVKLKYKIVGSSTGYIYSDPLTRVSGGWTSPGSTWDAVYQGSVKIDFNAAFAAYAGSKVHARLADPSPTPTDTATATPTATLDPTATPSSYTVELYSISQDNDGNSGHVLEATYTMSCP